MRDREDIDKELVRLYALSRIKDMTDQNRTDIHAKIDKLEELLDGDLGKIDPEDVAVRAEIIEDNTGLNDIFSALWFCCNADVVGGKLSIKGYVKFYVCMCKAFGCFVNNEEGDSMLMDKALSEYERDRDAYDSEITRAVFNDILFRMVELHTEYIDPMYYSAFAWALLDTVADLSRQPPKFRQYNHIECFMKGDNEGAMLSAYLNNDSQKAASALKVSNEWMERVPDVMQRIGARKKGVEITTHDLQMITIVANRLKKKKEDERSEAESDEDEHGSDYSATDDENAMDLEDLEGFEKAFAKAFDGPKGFDIALYKKRKRELKRNGVSRSDWLLYMVDLDMPVDLPIVELKRDTMKGTTFGTWMHKKSDDKQLKSPERGEPYQGSPAQLKAKKDSAGKKAFRTGGSGGWDDKVARLERLAAKKKSSRLAKTRAMTPKTPATPKVKMGKPDVTFGEGVTVLDAKVQPMYPKKEDDDDEEKDSKDREPGEFDGEEWLIFRAELKEMKKSDDAERKRVAEEKVRIDAEISERRQKMQEELKQRLADKMAESAAALEKKEKQQEDEQAYVDGLMAEVLPYNDPQNYVPVHATDSIKRIQHPYPDPTEEYLPGPVEYVVEEKPPSLLATLAIDEASQFDPAFDEMYEMDSFFSGSSAETISSNLIGKELAAAILASAQKAAEKKKRRVAKMERSVTEDEKRRGKWSVREEREKVRHMNSDYMEDISVFSGSDAGIGIEGPNVSMSISLPRTQPTSDLMAGDEQNKDVPQPKELQRELSVENLSVEGGDSLHSAEDGEAVVGTIGGDQQQFLPIIITEISGKEEATGLDLSNPIATGPEKVESAELAPLSYAMEDIEEGARAGESWVTVDPVNKTLASPNLMGGSNADVTSPKALPFPHKSYSTIVENFMMKAKEDGKPGGGEGQLGTWSHARAAQLHLRSRKGFIDEEEYIEPALDEVYREKIEALKPQKRELPWFQTTKPIRKRGTAFNPDDPTDPGPQKQRPVVRPEHTRKLMGSTGNLLLPKKESESKTTSSAEAAAPDVPRPGFQVNLPNGPSVVSGDSISASHDMIVSQGASVDLGTFDAATDVNALQDGGSPSTKKPKMRGGILSIDDTGTLEEELHLMTGVVPPPVEALGVNNNVLLQQREQRIGSPISRSQPMSIITAPVPKFSSMVDATLFQSKDDEPGRRIHNDLVKTIITGGKALAESPQFSPAKKNPAKPLNLVDGDDEDVARGFIKEPVPIPSPNRSKPISFLSEGGHSILVRQASFSRKNSPSGSPQMGQPQQTVSPTGSAFSPEDRQGGAMAMMETWSTGEGGDEGSIVSVLTANDDEATGVIPMLSQGKVGIKQPQSSIDDSLAIESTKATLPAQGSSPGNMDGVVRDTSLVQEESTLQLEDGVGTFSPIMHGTSRPSNPASTMPSLIVKKYTVVPVSPQSGHIHRGIVSNQQHRDPTEIYDTLTSEEAATTKHTKAPIRKVVTTIDKHMYALAPAEPDPIGPAKHMGLTSIEKHPRFVTTGLPAPTQPVVHHFMSRSLSMIDNKKEGNWRKERKDRWERDHPVLERYRVSERVISSGKERAGSEEGEVAESIQPTLSLQDNQQLAQALTDRAVPFWIPRNTRKADDPLYHERSSHLNRWDEAKFLLQSSASIDAVADRAATLMTIKRQEAFLERFKDFTLYTAMRDSNPEWTKFKHREEQLLPQGQNVILQPFTDKFKGKILPRKIGKFKAIKWRRPEDGSVS